jgi:hypothetical protein
MTTSPKNPHELLERYMQAVRFWLPRRQQQDILAELSGDLQAQVEEKESELGRPLELPEMEAILKSCGNPMVVASRYQPQGSLIGPAFFPIYKFVLKINILWILPPVFLLIVGPIMVWGATDRVGAVLQTFFLFGKAAFLNAAIITIIFALLERSQLSAKMCDNWSPLSLRPVAKPERDRSRTQSVFDFIMRAVWLLWLVVAPQVPFLIMGPFAYVFKPAPLWHVVYPAILLIAVAGVLYPWIGLARPEWTRLSLGVRLLLTMLNFFVLTFIVRAAAAPVGEGGWHPYLALAKPEYAGQYGNLDTIMNLCLLVAFGIASVATLITMIVEAWRLMQSLRGRGRTNGEAMASA